MFSPTTLLPFVIVLRYIWLPGFWPLFVSLRFLPYHIQFSFHPTVHLGPFPSPSLHYTHIKQQASKKIKIFTLSQFYAIKLPVSHWHQFDSRSHHIPHSIHYTNPHSFLHIKPLKKRPCGMFYSQFQVSVPDLQLFLLPVLIVASALECSAIGIF